MPQTPWLLSKDTSQPPAQVPLLQVGCDLAHRGPAPGYLFGTESGVRVARFSRYKYRTPSYI